MKRALLLIHAVVALQFGKIDLAVAQDQNSDSMMAVMMLQSLLFDPNAMAELSRKDPAAKEANDRLKAFPPWAQDEIRKIILEIMKAQGERAKNHVDVFEGGGALGAYQSFSPEVQRSISQLAERLQRDPSFKLSGSDDLKQLVTPK